jgi:drug/metabolite transporter (DMT)-like permease
MIVVNADYLKLHFIVFLWGFTAILGMLISLPPVEMIFYRTLLSASGLGVLMLVGNRSFRVSGKDATGLLLTGMLVAVHWIAFFGAARIANVSVSLVGFATASLWTAFIEPVSQRKRVKGFEVLLGLCVITGIAIIFSYQHNFRAGFIVAIFSGLMAAVFAVINARYTKRINARIITFYEMAGAALGTAVFFPLYAHHWADGGVLRLDATPLDWVYLFILAFICTVYAFTVMIELMKRIPVFFIQLTINLEPVYGIIMALLIFGETEKMAGNFYLGASIIVGAILFYPYLKRRFEKPVKLNG